MRRIERTNAFLRDFRREKRGQHRRDLEAVLTVVVSLLAEDHATTRKEIATMRWEETGATIESATFKPDLLLIDRKPDTEVLQLVRLGFDSELFG